MRDGLLVVGEKGTIFLSLESNFEYFAGLLGFVRTSISQA